MEANTRVIPKTNPFDLVGSIGSGVISAGANLLSNVITNRANERMQQKQNAWNLEMWNRNNEYNSPAAQMQRLQAAGLNPDLMYGQNAGDASGNSSSPAQGTNPIPKQPFHLDPLMLSQIRLFNAQAYKTTKEGNVADIQAQNDEEFSYKQNLLNLGLSEEQINYLSSMWQKNYKEMEQIDQNIENMKQQWSILHETIKTQAAQTNLLIQQGKTQEAACALYLAQKEGQELDNKQQEIINQYLPKTLQSQIDKNYADAKNALASANKNNAEARLANAQAETEDKSRDVKIENIKANTRNTNANTRLVNQQNKTEIFATKVKEQEAKYAGIHQALEVTNQGLDALKKITGALGSFAGAAVEAAVGL